MRDSRRLRGHLFVISGPSGAGKGTLRKRLFEALPDLVFSISCTTREPRPGEREGVDYRFLQPSDFLERIRQELFLEHAAVHGNYYGTLQEDVKRDLEAGRDVVLEIDVQGALQVRERFPEAILIFIMPPSQRELEKRLRGRGTEGEQILETRLRNAEMEMKFAGCYDHAVVNDELNRAAGELIAVVESYRKPENGTRQKQKG